MIELPVDDDLVLRQVGEDDAEELFALIECDRDYLGRWLPWVAATTTVDDEREFVRFSLRQWDSRAQLDLCVVTDGRVVGCAGLVNDPAARTAQIGYWIAQDAQGHGHATRAARTLERFAADELGCVRIEIHVATTNAPSRAVAERLGYVLEEIRPQGLVAGTDARIEDLAVYAWERGRPGSR